MQKKEAVAVKVVKNVRRYCEYAEAEAEVLKEIFRCDPARQSHVVELRDAFLIPPHQYCLVFERLGVTIYDFMLKECQHGLLVSTVQKIAQQLFQCLSFLHGLNLTHTDLKCRNVMFRDARYDVVPLPRVHGAEARKPSSAEIIVIDFGGALFAAERGDGKIGTRHYRAPEVIMGLPWDEKVDTWAAGCLLGMLYLGYRPIGASEDLEQLALMERIVGKEIPRPMAKEAISRDSSLCPNMFNKSGRLEWPKRAPDNDAVERVEKRQPLHELMRPQHETLLKLMHGSLQFDPKRRLSAQMACDMPFCVGDMDIQE